MIGDKDPEDAWDDVDPFAVKLEILRRAVKSIHREKNDGRFRAEGRRKDALRLVAKLEPNRVQIDDVADVRRQLEALADG